MIKKWFSAFSAAVLLSFALTVSSPAPAQAAPVNGCDPGNVCLYDWINFNYPSGFWQRSFSQFFASADSGTDNCINLINHQWHDLNGSPNNTASSMYINTGISSPKRIEFWDAAGCGAYGGYHYGYLVGSGSLYSESNMADTSRSWCQFGYCSLNWYDRVSSIRVTNQ